MFRITYLNRINLAKLIKIRKFFPIKMLRLCLSGGLRRFSPITLEKGYMSQYHQQRNIRTTIPSHRKIIELIEDEVLGIKITSSTRVVTRADCVCESLKNIVDLSEILDCCPFHQKELDYKLADGEMCRLCQAEDIPQCLLDLAWDVSWDHGEGLDTYDDYYVNEDTAELARAAAALSVKNFALANGIKLTTHEELINFANFFFLFNTRLLYYLKDAEHVYNSDHLCVIQSFMLELPKFAFDAKDIEDYTKWMEFVQKNTENLQEADAQMALMIEKKREKAGTREINRKNGGRTHNF